MNGETKRGAPRAGLEPTAAGAEFLALIPRDFAREHLLISQGRSEGVERLVVTAASDPAAIHNVGVRLQVPVVTDVGSADEIAATIDGAYGQVRAEVGVEFAPTAAGGEGIEGLLADAERDLLSTSGKGHVVKLVDAILFEALGRQASDVHVQPLADRALVRCRVDGVLYTLREIRKSLAVSIVSRVKVMGQMDIAERRIAQDGRATVTIGSRPVDVRISTFPTSYGERAVLRLLDNGHRLSELSELGMSAKIAERFLACTQRGSGIVLITGPTGCGKTTTLYSTLQRIASSELNVMTIEDPIEYDLSTVGLSVSQSQVNLRKGVTFATGLRHILRQDPDVILVGEIRDAETARMAIRSSLTGHVVFSTLHTNDAPSAVTRLLDLGIEPYLISSSLSGVLAQRLVRLKHQACAGSGCEACFGTGLLGRTGVFELMAIDDELRSLIARGADLNELRGVARKAGMRSLAEEGRQLVGSGKTSEREIARVVGDDR